MSDLASRVTKWSLACDRKLHRLVSYINANSRTVLVGWVGDKPGDLTLDLYVDADFAGDKRTMKSTSGHVLALSGPNTYVPLSAGSTKQKCVSHSTSESEIVAADSGLRKEGLPALQMWDVLFGRKATLTVYEDNSACLQIIKTGRNPALRHIQRTHNVSAQWLHWNFYEEDDSTVEKPYLKIKGVETEKQFADIFTKAFTKPAEWARVVANVGLRALRLPPASARAGGA